MEPFWIGIFAEVVCDAVRVAGALIGDDRLCTVYFQIHLGTHMQDLRTYKREQWPARDWFTDDRM